MTIKNFFIVIVIVIVIVISNALAIASGNGVSKIIKDISQQPHGIF